MTQPFQRVVLSTAASLLCVPLSAQQGDSPIPADTEVVTTDSGLKYSVLKAGDGGDKPKIGDQVEVHYTGWLTDGKVFDSSRRGGKPLKFVLGQVIEGWNQGVTLMSPGDRYKFTIPYDLAYGEQGNPPTIPAEATLIFDVELLSFEKGPEFRRLDPEKTVTADGLKYQVLVEGAGDPPKADDTMVMHFTFWNTEGRLMHTTAFNPEGTKGVPSGYLIEILKKGPQMVKPGGSVLFEVPPAMAFGDQDQGPNLPPGSTTIWRIDMERVVRPMEVPAFVMPPSDQLVETQSGLKYQVVKEGAADGREPRMGQMVQVHYAGWLTDGTNFDSSYSRGEPSEFRLGGVIQGWNEGLQLMKPGAVYRFVIPSNLAYGERGSPPKIGPGATLVFQVELIKVK